jgi:hypothetical protein
MWELALMESLDQDLTRNVKPELTTGPLRSLLNANPTLCHVFFAEVAGKARYTHLVIRASNKHIQTCRPPLCFDTLEPPAHTSHGTGEKVSTGSRQTPSVSTTLVSISAIASKVNRRKTRTAASPEVRLQRTNSKAARWHVNSMQAPSEL